MKKTIILTTVILAILALGGYFYYTKPKEAVYKTAKIERGQLVSAVSATGNLAAVVTVQVGTQVSGTIQKLYVDFNSPVKKGQAIAQIDPSLFEAAIEQTKGNYLSAVGNLSKAKIAVADAKRTLERNKLLLKQGIVAQSDFDAAQTAYDQNVALESSAAASVSQARGSLRQAETNLNYSTIRSPLDGTIVSRNVDVGQTVAASFSTPTLFTIAQDLTKMQIETSVDESDISKLKIGQTAGFTVDAYPDKQFKGIVRQIRNAPIVTQNVVTYVTVINVDNKDMLLKPGMTANVSIETMKKDDVIKIPSAAIRFRPKIDKDAPQKTVSAPAEKAPKKKGGQTVYILGKDNVPVAVSIKTGIASDRFVELLEGELKENDEVITEQVNSAKKQGGTGMPSGPRF
jgi:HlyD family secretion protein